MLEARMIGESGVIVARALPPFDMDQVDAFSTELADGAFPGMSLASPAIVDFRAVRLTDLHTADIRRYLTHRRDRQPAPGTGPIALVAGDLGSFGMLRMFAILAEIHGIRPEARTHVTDDVENALQWLSDRLGLGEADVAALAVGFAALSPGVEVAR